MTDKERRNQRRSAEDAVFNRMLLWLLGAVVAEVIILLVKRFYIDFTATSLGIGIAVVLSHIFQVYRFVGLALTVLGIISTLLKSPPSCSTTFCIMATSMGPSQVAYFFPSIPYGVSIPSPLREMIPEVLCWISAATAVVGRALSPATPGAMESWKETPNCALPEATRASAPPSGGCTISTSSP